MIWWLLACTGGRVVPTTEVPDAAVAEVQPASPENLALRPLEDFVGIADDTERSVALFEEISRVLLHPRCANCHPTDDRPRQTMAQVMHDPPVWRGPDNHGEPGMECSTCHQEANQKHARVPGAHDWHLAPASMGWIGRSTAFICEQLKDPARNGGKDLEAIHDHMANDALVAWGWAPGADRERAPGTQQELGELTRAWIDSGAHCPKESP